MNKNVKIILGIVIAVLLCGGLFFLSSLAENKNFKKINYNKFKHVIFVSKEGKRSFLNIFPGGVTGVSVIKISFTILIEYRFIS